MNARQYSPTEIDNEVKSTIKAMAARTQPYLQETFCNSYIQQLYKELFAFSRLLRDADRIDKISRRYGLKMSDSGFLFSLIDRLDNRFGKEDVDPRCLETARLSLEPFLFESLGKKQNVGVVGNGEEVITAMAAGSEYWNSLSGHFLSVLARTLFFKEVERKIPKATFAIEAAIERRTNALISEFAVIQEGKVDYSALMEYISTHWDWFESEMTK